jgi:hypothetical protein
MGLLNHRSWLWDGCADRRITSAKNSYLQENFTMKRLFVLFAVAALTVASAAQNYKITLFQESMVAGSTLKPGDYKLVVDGEKVVISKGKETVETTAKLETNQDKFSSTSVRYENGDGKYRVKEIRLGGTNTKLVFN